jgi:hypothetical protein
MPISAPVLSKPGNFKRSIMRKRWSRTGEFANAAIGGQTGVAEGS